MKRRILSIFMSVIVLINIIVPVCASAADATDKNSSVYIGNGYIVYYDVKSSWGDNQNIEIKIKNIGSEPIANWALKYDAHGEISGLWNATAYSNNDTQYIIKNSGYNYEIQPDQEVNFGYCVTGESLEVPKVFEICSQRTNKAENEYIVSLNVTNDWGTGFTGEIKIQNLSSEPIEAWRLNFDANFTIEDIWNARLVSADENSYCIANDVTTTPIAANETKTFGFKASKENGVTAEIYNCTVNGVTISENFETLEFLETGLVLTAFAQYNQTESAIDIYWNTTVQNGTYEILESDDNVKYNKITETSDFMFYSYKISENFSEKYFIVRQTTNDGRTVEADPILISNNGNGYSVGFPDTDGDGIPDYLEKDIGTDPQKADTDDDGLTDYEEFYLTGTDSTVYDSITEDVSDADADSDKDGLSNKKELDLGTNPLLEDTDKDGLSDGAETIIYGTDPLKYDTDDDGIGDGDEIALGLDPLNPQTFGVPDSEYTFEVDVPSDVESFSDINTDTNPFEVSVKMKAAGNILSNLDARESVYSKAMTNDATLGICPEFIYDDGCKIEEAVIQFKIDDEYAAEADTEKAEDSEFYGIKKYSIFKFFEDTGTLLPVKTEIDEENNTLSTTVDSLGSYCVIDMEKLLNDWLESEVETEEQPEVFQIVRSSVMYATMQMANNDTDVSAAETKTHIKETDPVNVFFFLDNRNTVGDEAFALAKESIVSASDIILRKSSDAHIYVVLCTNASSGAAYKLIDGNCADDSFTDISSLEGELDSITLRSTNTLSDNCVLSDALNYALDNYNKDRATYCFYLFNQKNVLFRESTGRSYLSKAKTAGFNVSIISEIDKAYIDGYALDLYKETDGIHIKKFSNFSNDILKHMYSSVPVIDDDTETYNMLLASGLQKVTLDAPITEDYKEAALDMWNNPNSTKYSDYADTDEDGLYDFQEIDFISDRIKFVNGKVKLPSFQDCLNEKSDLFYVEDGLSKYIAQIEKDDSLINMTDLRHKIYDKTYLLPILSDPTDETGDTDGDGFVDYYEYKCHENRNTENLDTSINYLNGLREDEWQAKSDLGRLVRIAGFNYDQQQKILRSDQYPIQRFFGFNRSIDVAADTVLSSSIYCDPICFFYDGKEYMLELWKGQYGIMSGAEVGLYYRTPTVYTRTITVADLVELVETIVNGLVDFEDVGIDVNEVIYQLARELSDDNILIEICDFLGVDLPELINNIIDMSYDLEDICDFLGIDLFDTVIYEHTYLDDYGCNYDPDNYYDEKWYRSVAPQDMIEVHYEFGIKDEDKSETTDVTEFNRDDYHWWTTGFEWGKYTNSEDEIVLNINIDFHSAAMRDAFYYGGDIPEDILSLGENKSNYLYENQKAGAEYFELNNKTNSNFHCEKVGETEVSIYYQDYCFNAQPQSDGDKDIIQANNLALLDVYKTAKEVAGIAYEYDSTDKLDRLLYTNDPNLITVDDFIYGFDATNFFAFNSAHTEFLKHAIAENAFGVDGDYTWALYNSLVTNLANNAVSFSYSKEYWSSLLNVGSSVLDVVDSLGVKLTVSDVLGILLLTGNNTNDLRLIAEQIADTKYTDGYSTQYLYEYYEDWYMQYAQMYDIMATSDNYDWNHFPGLIFSTEFLVNRVKNLRAS